MPTTFTPSGSAIDDLATYVRLLLIGDADMQAIWKSNISAARQGALGNEPLVAVTDMDNRELATYPRIVFIGEDGKQSPSGDLMPKFFQAKLRLEVVTRQAGACTDALGCLTAIKARVTELILGDPTQGLSGLMGTSFTSAWRVSTCWQGMPTGRLPVIDPEFKRWGVTYDALLTRLGV